MQIGELDRRITLESPTATHNNYGENVESYSDFRTIWAKVKFEGGSKTDEFDRITSITKAKFYIRNIGLSTFNEGFIITYDGKSYWIQAINEIEGRDSFLEIITEQRD
tara:strand:- start:181 stop:504 length:324 start_codon:yes stop_codon:yes gene_type:complete